MHPALSVFGKQLMLHTLDWGFWARQTRKGQKSWRQAGCEKRTKAGRRTSKLCLFCLDWFEISYNNNEEFNIFSGDRWWDQRTNTPIAQRAQAIYSASTTSEATSKSTSTPGYYLFSDEEYFSCMWPEDPRDLLISRPSSFERKIAEGGGNK